MATAVTSMRIPTELNERYSRLAKETGRSRSFYVNEALLSLSMSTPKLFQCLSKFAMR